VCVFVGARLTPSGWSQLSLLTGALLAVGCQQPPCPRAPTEPPLAPPAVPRVAAADTVDDDQGRVAEGDRASTSDVACSGDPWPRWDSKLSPGPAETTSTDDALTLPADDREAASRVVVAMRAGFRECFKTHLDRRGGDVSVVLVVHVNCTGSVLWVHGTSEGADRHTLECMFDVAAASRFDPPSRGWANIRVPVTLAKQ